MSGPHPKGPAEIRTEAEWGQGERGAEGYEDHGGSELSWTGSELLGGLSTGAGGEPLSETEMDSRAIDRSEWRAFLDRFSREHQGWRVNIEDVDEHGRRLTQADNQRLMGINLDHLDDPDERAYVEVGESVDDHLTHSIAAPRRICFLQTRRGAHLGLEILAQDGTRTFVRFRAPASPDLPGEHVA